MYHNSLTSISLAKKLSMQILFITKICPHFFQRRNAKTLNRLPIHVIHPNEYADFLSASSVEQVKRAQTATVTVRHFAATARAKSESTNSFADICIYAEAKCIMNNSPRHLNPIPVDLPRRIPAQNPCSLSLSLWFFIIILFSFV